MSHRYAPYSTPASRASRVSADGAGDGLSASFPDADRNRLIGAAASPDDVAVESNPTGAAPSLGVVHSWLDLRHAANRASHRTTDYESADAVGAIFARRGNKWRFRVAAEAFDAGDDPHVQISMWVTLSSGERASELRGSWIQLEEEEEEEERLEEEEETWRLIRRTNRSEDRLWIDFQLHIPVDASVSKYEADLELWRFDSHAADVADVADAGWSLVFPTVTTRCFVLFNPWCRRDDVFLDDEYRRDEYVLNDVGRIFRGSAENPRGLSWNFGQFEPECVEAAFAIVEKIEEFDGRSDVVNVMRTVSQILNAMDDDGVLAGNWTGDYTGGRAPWSWNGSLAILSQWFRTRSPVNYGQCWVFSALATTVCRSLGIPSRCITNFESGHDTNANLVLEFYVNADGSREDRNTDSKWNFHVWNEGWTRRRDLGAATSSSSGVYDGWQAFDATPQEESRGLMRCGPAPVKAIKEGDVKTPFDAKFIFAEVNGTLIYYHCACSFKRERHWGKHKVVHVDSRGVGKNVSTKAVGRQNNARMDVTHLYKYPEGSEEEEAALNRAHPRTNRHVKKLVDFVKKEGKMSCSFVVSPRNCVADAGVEVSATLEIRAPPEIGVDIEFLCITVGAYTYSGRPIAYDIKSLVKTAEIPAGEKKPFRLAVDESEYLRFVKRDAFLVFRCAAQPRGAPAKEVFVDRKTVDLNLPEIAMEILSSSSAFDETDSAMDGGRGGGNDDPSLRRLRLVFKNPLDEVLEDCVFHVEGANMAPVETPPSICGAKGSIERVVEIRPKLKGAREVFASFTSNLISSVGASLPIIVP